MAETLPYMNSTGLVTKILNKVKEAKAPDRFSQDYLGTVLNFNSGSARPFIPMAKRLGLLNSDGTPTPLYHRFRGSESGAAMAEAIRKGYAPLYKRNEFAHKLDKKKLEGLILEITGMEEGNSVLRAITGTFDALKAFADFDATEDGGDGGGDGGSGSSEGGGDGDTGGGPGGSGGGGGDDLPMRFGYTININLPDTDDIAVFNAIFKSMKEHLL